VKRKRKRKGKERSIKKRIEELGNEKKRRRKRQSVK
jgi:hypothetical protein